MALPVPSFAALPAGNQPLSLFDQQFAAVANGMTLSCSASGTNTLVLTPNPNSYVPTAYTEGAPRFVWVQPVTSTTGPVTINVANLGAITAYRANGTQALGVVAGDLVAGNVYTATYSQALSSGSGGFAVDVVPLQGPPGATGQTGATGATGPQGPAGPTLGLPAGGATGYVLTKTSATDYATAWQPSGASGVSSFNTRSGAVTLTAADVTGTNACLPLIGGTLSGNLAIAWANPNLTLNKSAAAAQNAIWGATAGSTRWNVVLGDQTAESGSNAGSNFLVARYTDTGAYIDTPLSIRRSDGQIQANSPVGIFISPSTAPANANIVLNKTGSGQYNAITGQTGGLSRWAIELGTSAAESFGTNAGSFFAVDRYNDSGANVDSPIWIARDTGFVALNQTRVSGWGIQYPALGGTHYLGYTWTGSAITAWVSGTNVGNLAFASDYRTKKDVASLPQMWEVVKRLRPVKYTQTEAFGGLFTADDKERWGFVAHELQEATIEDAATGHKDEENVVQSPNLMTVVAALTKALQEAMTRIEALEARTVGG